MADIKTIRTALGVTQQELAEGLGCTQSNVSNYERGQTIPPDVAGRLIEFAGGKGVALTYDHVYGGAALGAVQEQVHVGIGSE